MSNAGDLKIQISADLGTAERALNKLKTDAQAAGDAGARGLSRLEASLTGVNRSADTASLQRYNRQIEQIQRSTAGLETSFNRATGTVGRLAAALGGVYAAQRGAAGFVALSDQATLLEGRLRLVTSSTEELTSVQRELFQISQRTRSEFASNVELYTRSSQALRQLGATSEQTLRLTETLNQAFSISGATSAEASNALIQLSQAFSSGVLRGEELNSVMEQGPRVIQALSDALGKTRGELRAMAEEGKLTSRLVFDALLNQAPKIANEFSNIPRTVGQAMTQLRNDFLMAVQQTNNATGSTAKLVEQVDRLRNVVQASDFQAAFTFIARGMINVIEDVTRAYSAVSAAGDATRSFFKETYNSIVDLMANAVKVALDAANEIIIAFGGAIEKINSIGLIQIANPFATWDLDSLGVSERIRAAKVSVEELANISGRLADTGGMVEGQDALRAALERQREQLEAASGETSAFTYELGENAKEAEKAAERYAKAQLSRMRGYEDTVSALQREIQTFGMSEGAVAALSFRFEALTAAKRAAEDANRAVSPEEIAAINSAASQVGILTDQLAEYNRQKQQTDRLNEFQNDLFFRSQQLGRTELERSVAESLRSVGLEYGNAANAGIEAQVRYIEQLEAVKEETLDIRKITTDSFQEIIEAISGGENAIDGLIGGLARLGQEFARQGLQKAFGNLFPQNQTNLPTNGNIQPGSGASPYFASNGPTSVQPLRALNDNLQSSANSALAVAKQFDGLNERADSKVLDSFLRASGNWNNLSAKDTAWCAAFANAAIVQSGGQGTGSNLASSFMNWGQSTNAPKPGDIVVLKPQSAGASGHVGFVAGFENGKVQIFGGNQSNAANTKSFGLDQVRDYRTGSGTGGLSLAVSDGFVDAQKKLSSGNVPGVDRWAGMRQATPGAGGLAQQSGGAADALSGVRNFLQSPMGQTGMAGVTAFAGGMQSGSPIGGALNGGLAAFGMGLGPVGMAVGAIGGLLGGLFGRSKRKKEERRQRQEQERQQMLQAQQQLAQQLPAILELQDVLLDRASGTLQKEKARIESQLKQYRDLAAQAKDQGEVKRLEEMTAALDDYMNRLYDQVRLTAGSIIESLNQGRGLEPAFAKAAAEMREMSLALRNYIADLIAAVGETSDLVSQARAASREQLLRQLSGPQEVTEIYTKLDTLAGTAAGLGAELQKLGLNAEQAADAIRDHLNRGIQKMRDDFVKGIAGEIVDAQGYGYAGQVQSLIERRNTMRADAVSLGADPALIDRWFKVQVQSIVDQSGLLDESLKNLTEAFPELVGVVTQSNRKIEDAFSKAQDDLRTAYSRLKGFTEALSQFRKDIALDSNLSTLSPFDKLTEAQARFREVSEKAASGDAEAQAQLIELSRSYLDEAKSYYASSDHYFQVFDEVNGVLKRTETGALAELDIAKSQYQKLLDIDESVKSIPQALAAMNEAQAARDLAQGNALQAYVQALNPQAAIPSYQQPNVSVTPGAVAPTPAVTPPAPQPVQNATLWTGSGWSNYVGNYQDYNGRRIFVPSGMTPEQAWVLNVRQQDAPRGGQFGPTYNEKRLGGPIGSGFAGLTGFQSGGMINNGIYDVDSVVARHANGGAVKLAGGEFVTRAPSVNTETRSMLDFINKTGSLPRMASNENRLEGVERRLDRLTQAVAIGFQSNIGAVERGNKIAESQGDNMQLMASR